MINDPTVSGYAYNSVTWAIIEPALSPRHARGFRLSEQLWAGGVIEATVPTMGQVEDMWAYQVKVDATPEAIEEATGLLRAQHPAAEDLVPLGIARFKRFRANAQDPEEGEHRVALEGLDESHLVDRLTTAILVWHAQIHGEGPFRVRKVAKAP